MTDLTPIKMEKDLLAIREKVEKHNQWPDFTADEKALIEASFDEIQKKYGSSARANTNCSQCAPDIIKIVRNWFGIIDRRPVQRVKKNLTPKAKAKPEKPEPVKVKTGKAEKKEDGTIAIPVEVEVDYSAFKHPQLKKLCKERGLVAKPSYDKATLVKMLEEADKAN